MNGNRVEVNGPPAELDAVRAHLLASGSESPAEPVPDFTDLFPDEPALVAVPAPPPAAAAEERAPSPDDATVIAAIDATWTKRRAKLRPAPDGHVRGKTIPPGHMTRDERRLTFLPIYPEDVERPRTRGECVDGPRPCPFVSCAHHLYLDVNQETGAIKLNFPHLEVEDMPETCSLDIADRGGETLDAVGTALNITRERIRQVETKALVRIRSRKRLLEKLEIPPERDRTDPF